MARYVTRKVNEDKNKVLTVIYDKQRIVVDLEKAWRDPHTGQYYISESDVIIYLDFSNLPHKKELG